MHNQKAYKGKQKYFYRNCKGKVNDIKIVEKDNDDAAKGVMVASGMDGLEQKLSGNTSGRIQ
ncbi:MAG: hypothetical protein R2757_03515 [Draconibacterium sp.]